MSGRTASGNGNVGKAIGKWPPLDPSPRPLTPSAYWQLQLGGRQTSAAACRPLCHPLFTRFLICTSIHIDQTENATSVLRNSLLLKPFITNQTTWQALLSSKMIN